MDRSPPSLLHTPNITYSPQCLQIMSQHIEIIVPQHPTTVAADHIVVVMYIDGVPEIVSAVVSSVFDNESVLPPETLCA